MNNEKNTKRKGKVVRIMPETEQLLLQNLPELIESEGLAYAVAVVVHERFEAPLPLSASERKGEGGKKLRGPSKYHPRKPKTDKN
ncbi:MAG: hypothetical protein K1Y36_30435 [Blastocatellia bacterium]|nr:hypothetical protein [Blastocatellia bacterium]